MKFVKPKLNETFTITSTPAWPNIAFETDQKGPHIWTWTLVWKTFTKTGKATTLDNVWDALSVVNDLGGVLTVRADANKIHATIKVKIIGTNPSETEVNDYLKSKSNVEGFDKIIAQESRYRHFNKSEPVKSFDNGYGMCQLTIPKPTFQQVWNWKLNIDGGLALFEKKRVVAISHLSQSGRTYTPDQLKSESVCRWNGGTYHEWDSKGAKWARHDHILCDSRTGNIGWDMNDPENSGKTEDQLHKRDSASYAKRPSDAHWNYYGVCYADHLLGTTPAPTPTAAPSATADKSATAPNTGPANKQSSPAKSPAVSPNPMPMPPVLHPGSPSISPMPISVSSKMA